MGKILKILLVLFLLALGSYLFLTIQWGPYGKGGTVYIPKGTSVDRIAKELEGAGIIRNTWSFKLLLRLKGEDKKLQPGEYEFGPKVATREVIRKLVAGERVVRRLTIPEGYNFEQIAQMLAAKGIAPEAQIKRAFRDPKYLGQLGFPAESLEGYLFPATYEYDRGTTLEDLLTRMIQTFKDNFTPDLKSRAIQSGWTLPQVVTLASIIEKETGQASERPLIASVFQNRLQIGMPLQSDPTVIYGLENYDGNIRKRDLSDPHPYNTYVHVGLPPGPIASPGKDSLKAVLYPAQTQYLFFVAKGDGSHQFSTNLEEHNEAVRKYQLGKGVVEAETMPESLPETNP